MPALVAATRTPGVGLGERLVTIPGMVLSMGTHEFPVSEVRYSELVLPTRPVSNGDAVGKLAESVDPVT